MGFYPALPAPRLAYDADGTKVFRIIQGSGNNNTGAIIGQITELTTAQKQTINNENLDAFTSVETRDYMSFIFPETMIIYGYNLIASPQAANTLVSYPVEYSNDTTNGLDGNWTSIETAQVNNSSAIFPLYRTGIRTLPSSVTAKSIRFRLASVSAANINNTSWRLINIYAIPASPTSLQFWHPTNNEAIAGSYFDFEDVAQNTTAIKQFRIKNSNSLTANNIELSLSFLTNQAVSLIGQYSLSIDNSIYSSTINITSLNPGEISSILYLKKATASNATLGLHSGRIRSIVGSWT